MTDIEKRKSALEADIKLLRGACGGTTGPTTGALMRVCSELEIYLAPSPQAPDNEVDEAVIMAMDALENEDNMGVTKINVNHLKSIIRAAQQPRQEWFDISTAPRDGSRFLGIDKSGYIEVVFQSDEEDYFTNGARWDIGSRNSSDRHVKFEITHWQPSPAPPKDK